MPYLALADVAGIQNYIFRYPELKQIAARSARIEALSAPHGDFHRLGAECLVAAGGNAVFRARDCSTLQTALRRLSRVFLEEGEGMEAVVSLEEYAEGELPTAYRHALEALERRKLRQRRDASFTFSGLAKPEPYPSPPPVAIPSVSAIVPPFSFSLPEPTEFRDLICGSREETGLMAVVSVDGIGMGQQMNRWLTNWEARRGDADADFLREFRAWSMGLKERWRNAWFVTRTALEAAFPESRGFVLNHPVLFRRALWLARRPGHPPYLPCRRIYQGGDDLAFVCDARIALSFTEILLRQLRDLPGPQGAPPEFCTVNASAGIVFVNTHFPFSRAIRLADQVRQRAKKTAVEAGALMGTDPPPCMNWWVNQRGALTEPEPPFPGATLKPYLIGATTPIHLLDWEAMDRVVLPGMWQAFAGSRAKLKEVTEAVEYGDDGRSVRRLLRLRPLRTPQGTVASAPFPWTAPFAAETGFYGGATPLLDASELYDLHFPYGDHRNESPPREKSEVRMGLEP